MRRRRTRRWRGDDSDRMATDDSDGLATDDPGEAAAIMVWLETAAVASESAERISVLRLVDPE